MGPGPVRGSSASHARRPVRCRIDAATERPPAGLGRQALLVMLHPPAPGCVAAAEGLVDQALVAGWAAFHHRPVGLGYLALLEHQAELLQRLAMAAEHEAAGCILVQPMGQRRISRQSEGQLAKELFEVDLAGAVALRPAMHGHAGRLVEHKHQRVPVEQARLQVQRGAEGIGNGTHPSRLKLPVFRGNRYRGGRRDRTAPGMPSSDNDKKPGIPIPPVRPRAAAPCGRRAGHASGRPIRTGPGGAARLLVAEAAGRPVPLVLGDRNGYHGPLHQAQAGP